MKLELDPEEARQLLDVIADRLIADAAFADEDRAALRRWRSESMTPGSEGMRELTTKLNAEIERTLRAKAKSAVLKPDWR